MKSRIFTTLLILFISLVAVNAQSAGKKNPMGTWKFSAPYAPEGYSSGVIVFGKADQKNTATMSFGSTSDYKMNGDNLKIKNDSICYSIFLEGQDIKVQLKIESDTNMTGKAVYSEGEVPLTLSKVIEKTK
jgi:hypothetical protein